MTPLLLGPDETSSSSEGEEEGSSDEEEADAAHTSKQPQSQKQGQHAYLQGYDEKCHGPWEHADMGRKMRA
jgi:hypothetical protein